MAVLMAIVGFLEAIAWPLVVGIALIMFREPLSHFFQELGPRITKVSIAQIVTTELSIPETVQPKLDQLLPALQKLNSGEYTSNITVLFQQIATAEALDCLVVDLESGWLTSRLFLFTIMFRRVSANEHPDHLPQNC